MGHPRIIDTAEVRTDGTPEDRKSSDIRLAAHQFVDVAGRCPCLSAPDPRSVTRALAAPLTGPRTALSSVIMEGIGPVRGRACRLLREPPIERVVLRGS